MNNIMSIKKENKETYIPVWGIIAGAVVVESVVKNICKTVTKIKIDKK